MSHDYGPLRTYEITWKSGHIETVQGHQVLFGSDKTSFASTFGGIAVRDDLAPRFAVHGMFGEHWRLVLTGPEADLLSVRDVTDRESVPAVGAGQMGSDE
jgi:hypothetical protein